MLDADLRLRLDRLSLDAALTAAAGEVVAILGPNGAGKSTILRVVSGQLKPRRGTVSFDEPTFRGDLIGAVYAEVESSQQIEGFDLKPQTHGKPFGLRG